MDKHWGTATAASTYDDDTPFPIVFNTPVTCKFVKLTILQSFDESENPRFLIGEIGAYEYLDWNLWVSVNFYPLIVAHTDLASEVFHYFGGFFVLI